MKSKSKDIVTNITVHNGVEHIDKAIKASNIPDKNYSVHSNVVTIENQMYAKKFIKAMKFIRDNE